MFAYALFSFFHRSTLPRFSKFSITANARAILKLREEWRKCIVKSLFRIPSNFKYDACHIFIDYINGWQIKLKKTSFVLAATIIMLVVVSLAYNTIPSASSADSTSVQEWQLIVTGLVNNPFNLSWTEIVAMPKTTVNATLVCVDAPRTALMAGNWTGVKLRTLLEEAEVSAAAIKVGFHAADGYSTDLTVETAMRDDIILAYDINGIPLNDLRLVVPGKWGYKWISQLTVIEFVDYNFLGLWESQGYSDEANTGQIVAINDSMSSLLIPSPTPTPTTSPPPSPSPPPAASPTPAPSQQPTPTPETLKGSFLPIEAVYATASSLAIVIVIFGVIVVRKRKK